MKKVLIDTSSWIEAFRKNGDVKISLRVKKLMEDGLACWCDAIVLELWHGARGESERKFLGELRRTIDCYPIDNDVWNLAIKLASKTREKGLTVKSVDLLIAACAFKNELELEHNDKHLLKLSEYRRSAD